MSVLTARPDDLPARPAIPDRRREHLCYTGMAIAVALTVFAGFARTYYLRPHFTAEPLRPRLHLHGLVFTSWVVLLLTQTTLIANHRVAIHRRLGIAGSVLAALMIILGSVVAITRVKEGFTPAGGPPPLVFLAIPPGDMVVFAILVGAGIAFRRRPDVHQRLMILATISLLAAPIARLPLSILKAGPLVLFAIADLFLVPLVLYDLVTRGRLHRATAWGALVLVASQPPRLMLSGTGAWLAFATWLTH